MSIYITLALPAQEGGTEVSVAKALEAALELFSSRRFGATSMRRIAFESGPSFGNKQAQDLHVAAPHLSSHEWRRSHLEQLLAPVVRAIPSRRSSPALWPTKFERFEVYEERFQYTHGYSSISALSPAWYQRPERVAMT